MKRRLKWPADCHLGHSCCQRIPGSPSQVGSQLPLNPPRLGAFPRPALYPVSTCSRQASRVHFEPFPVQHLYGRLFIASKAHGVRLLYYADYNALFIPCHRCYEQAATTLTRIQQLCKVLGLKINPGKYKNHSLWIPTSSCSAALRHYRHKVQIHPSIPGCLAGPLSYLQAAYPLLEKPDLSPHQCTPDLKYGE